jgi:carboxymethylenebutenolidase
LVPDLFQGAAWSKGQPESAFEEWKEVFSPEIAAETINLATEYLAGNVSAGKLVLLGFGYGGGRLIETLARDSEKIYAKGAFLYGTGFDSSVAEQIKVPLLLIAGDGDESCSPTVIRQIEEVVPGSKTKIYPGFGHAFAHRPSNSEEDEVSEDAFNEIRHWLNDGLPPAQKTD